MQVTTQAFQRNAGAALHNPALQKALKNIKIGFVRKRAAAVAKLPEFEALREARPRAEKPRSRPSGFLSGTV